MSLNFADYHVPVEADTRDLHVEFIDSQDTSVPLGIKGTVLAKWAWSESRPRLPTRCSCDGANVQVCTSATLTAAQQSGDVPSRAWRDE